jgi:hypothetical protein
MAKEIPYDVAEPGLQGGSPVDEGTSASVLPNTAKHVFTPHPRDGRIVSIQRFQDILIVACEYGVYTLTPTGDSIEWILQRVGECGVPRECLRF